MVHKIIAVICLTAVLGAGIFFVGNRLGLGYALAESKVLIDSQSNITDIKELQKLAEKGDAGAQYNLGLIFVNGELIEYYTKSNNVLGQLRRGVGGTGTPMVHLLGSTVENSNIPGALRL